MTESGWSIEKKLRKEHRVLRWTIWQFIKAVITFVAAWSLQGALANAGHYIELSNILLAAIMIVVVIKLWSWDYKRGSTD